MKKLLIIPFLFFSLLSFSTNYYVKNGGSDSAIGLSDATAWASVSKVVSSMSIFQPGDSILFKKGGTWTNALLTIGREGIAGKNIIISSYGSGAKPILSAQAGMPVIYVTTSARGYWTINDLDLRASTPPGGLAQSVGIYFAYWLADLGPVPGWEIKNCRFNCSILVSGPDTWVHHNIFAGDYVHNGNNKGGAIIVRGPEGDNCLIENNTIYGYTDRGIWIMRGGSNPVIRNNTTYDIWGDYPNTDNPGSGINIDGYGVAISGAKVYNNYAYNCSGLGIFLENAFGAEAYDNKLVNCGWGGFSIYWYPEHYGEPSNVNVHHNLVHNGTWGVLVNAASNWTIANNVFIKDDVFGATFDRNGLYITTPTYVANGTFTNNIIAGTGYVHAVMLPDTKNIWTMFDYNIIQPIGNEVVNRGGTSLTLSQVQALGFMMHGSTADPKFVNANSDWHLQSTSPAINAGTNMNYTRDFDGNPIGSAPDIGPYEYTGIVTQPVIPLYISSAVQNMSPSVIEMNYNTTLANIVPAASAFTVNINSVVNQVSSVSISGSKVLLSLSTPVIYGNTVTVAYTIPLSNPLQSTSGGQAANLIAQPVTNNISATVPLYVSSTVQNTAPSVIEMNYNTSLANIVPAASAFTVNINSVARTVSSVSISGSKVLLTLSSPVIYGNTVTVAYSKPVSNPLQSTSGGQAASLTAQPVTNNVSATVPLYVSSTVQNTAPSVIEMNYNTTLANIVPAVSAFIVNINSVARTVSSVSISGSKVLLTLSAPVVYGNTVTVAYTKPVSNPLQSMSGGQAVSLTSQPVTNNVSADLPQYVSSAIQNTDPSVIEMNYNTTLANIVPADSAFAVNINSVARIVNSVSISGSKVLLTLSTPVVYGNTVTVAYTKPPSNPLQSTSGAQAVSLTSQPVTNNVSATVPQYISSTVQNTAPSVIEMNYNTTLANIVPDALSFAVNINSVARTVNSVSISGSKVLLTLSTPVVYGNTVTVAYTKPPSNPLQSTSGGQAVSLTSQPVTNNVSATVPQYISSTIENTAPSVIEMNYNTTLANIVPSASAFIVTINSVAMTVNSVLILGSKVLLTLSAPVVFGNTVTVAYTKPVSNPLQSMSGGQSASLTAQPVTNNVSAAIPLYVSSVVQNTAPSVIELNYNTTLANIVPAASSFTVTINSLVNQVISVSISGYKVLLTLSSPVTSGYPVTIAYTKPTSDPLQSTMGGQAVSFAAKPVTNNVKRNIQHYVKSTVQNTSPSLVEMSYDTTLSDSIPNPSAFSVMVNSTESHVRSLSVSGSKVLLSLENPVVHGDVITVAYSNQIGRQLRTADDNPVLEISPSPVDNNVESSVIIYPNPVKGVLNISYNFVSDGALTLKILDLTGKVWLERDFYLSSAKLSLLLDLKPSVYIIYILSGSNVLHVQKLIVVKE